MAISPRRNAVTKSLVNLPLCGSPRCRPFPLLFFSFHTTLFCFFSARTRRRGEQPLPFLSFSPEEVRQRPFSISPPPPFPLQTFRFFPLFPSFLQPQWRMNASMPCLVTSDQRAPAFEHDKGFSSPFFFRGLSFERYAESVMRLFAIFFSEEMALPLQKQSGTFSLPLIYFFFPFR